MVMLQKEDKDWGKEMYGVEGSTPRGRPVVHYYQAQILNREGTMDHC